MKTIKYYEQAIEILGILGNNEVFRKRFIHEIAKENPKKFVETALKVYPESYNILGLEKLEDREKIKSIYDKAIVIAKMEGKVSAVKYLRSELNLSLKESKELIESLTNNFKGNNRP